MIFLFTEIDHPALFKELGNPEADHILACEYFLIEEILFSHNVHWMKRTPTGVISLFEGGEPALAAIAIQKDFQDHVWKGFDKAKIRLALHVGEAEKFGQSYVGPDVNHALKLLDAAYGGQVLLTVPAVHFIPLPPGGRLLDLGIHQLKDLSEPQNIYALQHPSLSQDKHPALRSLQHYPQNLSAQTSPFFGREEEMREITGLLTQSSFRLITLAGPGGFGKTRLSLQSAAEVVEKFKDGVYLVALAPLLSDQLMVGAIANVIKFFFYGAEDPKTQLLNYLKEKEMLLVMDNFEHIIGGAQLVAEMLGAAPGLKILVTSRESLRIEGEKVLEVKGLRYPEGGQTNEMEASSAVQLFVKSAHRIRPDFSLKAEEREPLLKICRLLEGMPLGLELSATWVATLPLDEIADKIESNRDFLATSMPHLPPRHRSLRAVFEYSWILLSEPQKKFLKAISVFRGGFHEQAARQVAGGAEKVLPYLENKSLLRKKSDGRYEIHELLKYYAKEKLFDEPAEKEKALDAHCAYYAHLLQKKEKDLFGPSRRKVLDELAGEIDNIREGWNRAVEKADEKKIGAYVDGLFSLYGPKGWYRQGVEAFQRAAETIREKYRGSSRMPSASRILLAKLLCRWAEFEKNLSDIRKARKLFQESLDLFHGASAQNLSGPALVGMGVVQETVGGNEKAKAYYEKGLKVFQRTKDRWGIAWALNHLGHIASRLSEHNRALDILRQSLDYSEAKKDGDQMAFSYNLMGDTLHELGRMEEARSFHQKGLSAYLESGDRQGVAWSFINLGREAEALGDYAGARQMYQEGMAISRDLGDIRALAWCDVLIGFINWATGEYQEALALYEEGLFLYREVGDLRGEAWALDMLGNLRLAMREDQEAEKFYLKAYSIVIKEGVSLQNVAWNFYHLGTISQFRSQFAEARQRFLKALAGFERLGDNLGQVTTLTHLGETACAQKNFPESEKYFQRAVRLALQAKAAPQLVDVLVGLAQLLRAQGEEQQAIRFLMAALNHSTCRRQTKDRVLTLAMELKSLFSTEEVESILLWAKASSIEEVAAAWFDSKKPARATRKKNKKELKPSRPSRRKIKGKPGFYQKPKRKRRK